MEIDWQTFYSRFFSKIRIKINCKDPSKIPRQRVVEMDNQLYLLEFTVESFYQVQDQLADNDKKDKSDEDEGDLDKDDLLSDELGDRNNDKDQSYKADKTLEDKDKDMSNKSFANKRHDTSQRGDSVRTTLQLIDISKEDGHVCGF
ncbi:hypothetical protein BAE44_0002101 [Dichanthelium oligosanthes]|uniref:Uncharacterized protein n=1 Tax=Dichanthelium oligosanthes TaxID=888268 RepID=A0A1E5WIB7_9POAL|nr:hypothetical protein BAE44_0002101 [Dichanthelium oligosanthes]